MAETIFDKVLTDQDIGVSIYSKSETDSAIEQSMANQVKQGTISNAKISDTIRTSTVPVGISIWYTQYATDSPSYGNATTTIIMKPTSTGNYAVCLLFAANACYVSNGLTASGEFTWHQLQNAT